MMVMVIVCQGLMCVDVSLKMQLRKVAKDHNAGIDTALSGETLTCITSCAVLFCHSLLHVCCLESWVLNISHFCSTSLLFSSPLCTCLVMSCLVLSD